MPLKVINLVYTSRIKIIKIIEKNRNLIYLKINVFHFIIGTIFQHLTMCT